MNNSELSKMGQRPAAPQVITWFKVYAGCLLAVYVFACGVGLIMLINPDIFVETNADFSSPTETRIMGTIYFILGAVFAAAYLFAFFFNAGKGAWIYDLVLICIGFTSCCCIPACIPLLIFWIRDDCKNWFYQSVPQ